MKDLAGLIHPFNTQTWNIYSTAPHVEKYISHDWFYVVGNQAESFSQLEWNKTEQFIAVSLRKKMFLCCAHRRNRDFYDGLCIQMNVVMCMQLCVQSLQSAKCVEENDLFCCALKSVGHGTKLD